MYLQQVDKNRNVVNTNLVFLIMFFFFFVKTFTGLDQLDGNFRGCSLEFYQTNILFFLSVSVAEGPLMMTYVVC